MISLLFKPNLSCILPVDILVLVFASILGFNLKPTLTFFPNLLANFCMLFNSLSDSTFIRSIFLLIANLSSSNFFPTPEYTILFGSKPKDNTFFNSPSDTTSAPSPCSLIILSIVAVSYTHLTLPTTTIV